MNSNNNVWAGIGFLVLGIVVGALAVYLWIRRTSKSVKEVVKPTSKAGTTKIEVKETPAEKEPEVVVETKKEVKK